MVAALQVQGVRFGGERSALVRMVESLAAACAELRRQRSIGTIRFALGDAGQPDDPQAVLDGPLLERVRSELARAGVELDHVAFGANVGHGGGQNRLATRRSAAAGDRIVFANPDTYLAPTCLVRLLGAFDDDPQVGIAEARQLPLEHPKPFDAVTGDTPWASGCLSCIDGQLFDQVGGFEPAFFLHGDDVDLSWRVRLVGKRIVHVPGAAVFHDKRPTASGFPAPTPEEERQGMLARLLLAHRAERPDIIDTWMQWASQHGTRRHQQGADEFRRRQQAGELPSDYRSALRVSAEQVAAVATFVGGEYAQHRF